MEQGLEELYFFERDSSFDILSNNDLKSTGIGLILKFSHPGTDCQ